MSALDSSEVLLSLQRLPQELLLQALGYLDGPCLGYFEITCRGTLNVDYLNESLWSALFSRTKWTSIAIQTLQSRGRVEGGAAVPGGARAWYRGAWYRERGPVVVELGAFQHRVGHFLLAAPRFVPREHLDVGFDDLLLPGPPGEAACGAFVFGVAAAARQFPMALLLVVPATAPRHGLLALARRLGLLGCRRLRFERAPACALLARLVHSPRPRARWASSKSPNACACARARARAFVCVSVFAKRRRK